MIKEIISSKYPVIFYESVHRIIKSLEQLQQAGVKINVPLVKAGAVLHDLFKMAGIKNPSPNQHHSEIFTAEELAMWEQLRQRFPNKFENEIAYEIFKEEFPELALVLLNEGNPFLRSRTTEESIIHYADYRIFKDKIVLLQERFAYFEKMYPAPENFWLQYLAYCQEEENRIFQALKIKPEELNAAINV